MITSGRHWVTVTASTVLATMVCATTATSGGIMFLLPAVTHSILMNLNAEDFARGGELDGDNVNAPFYVLQVLLTDIDAPGIQNMGLLGRCDCILWNSKRLTGARFHFYQHANITVTSNNVDFTLRAPPIPLNDLIAVRRKSPSREFFAQLAHCGAAILSAHEALSLYHCPLQSTMIECLQPEIVAHLERH